MKKIIILDKDGTLTTPKSGNQFVQSPDDQILFPRAFECVKAQIDTGAIAVIASNQGGVAAGHKTIQDAVAEMQYCLELFEGLIDTAFFCPDYEGEWIYAVGPKDPDHPRLENYCFFQGTDFRKPGAGILRFAMLEYPEIKKIPRIHAHECLMVGDRPEDSQAAIAAGVDFMWAQEWRSERNRGFNNES